MAGDKLVAGEWECTSKEKEIRCEKQRDASYGPGFSSPASMIQMFQKGGTNMKINTVSNSVNIDSSNQDNAIELMTEEV